MARRPARRPLRRNAASVRARAAQPLRLLLTALLLVIAHGATLLHVALVPHRTCEHGQLVELGHDAESVDVEGGDAQREEGRSLRAGAEEEHSHCAVQALIHRPVAVAALPGEPACLSFAPVPSCEGAREARPVPPLSLAPKSSPPSA